MTRKRTADPTLSARALAFVGTLMLGVGAFVLHALPLVLILTGTTAGVCQLWRTAMSDPRFVIAGDTLSLTGSARFCEEAVAEVERLGRCASGRSLLDPWLLQELRREYEQSAWVKRVHSLRRIFPNRLGVEFVLRTPALQVKQDGYHWTVDSDGVLLKVKGTRAPAKGVPVLEGTTPDALTRRPAVPGRQWSDSALHDALSLLRELEASPLSEDLEVSRIYVHAGTFVNRENRRLRKRPRYDLETQQGAVIRWGTFNAGDFPDEMLTAEKLLSLRSMVARDFARIPGVALDVRTPTAGFTLPREP